MISLDGVPMISFRAVRLEDKQQLRIWRNLPQIRRFMLTDHEITAEEHAAWFERILDSPQHRHWIIQCEGKDVGLLNLYNIDTLNRCCSWGFYVAGPNVRGKNVGMFAEYFVLQYVFEELRFEKLCCETLDFNRGVLRMHEAFGFRTEGELVGHVMKDESKNVVRMAITREQWTQKRPQFEQIFRSNGLIEA